MANQGAPHGRNGNGNRNRDDEPRDDDRYAMSRNVRDMRDPDREAYDRNNFGPTYSRPDRGRDDGQQGYRDEPRGRGESFGPQGGWNTEDRFGRRDDYQSNQDYGMRDREYSRGQSGYGAGNQPRDPSRQPGNYGVGARDSERADRMQRSFRGVGPQGYSRSDQRIHEDVSDTFTDDHHLDAAGITVKVQGGEVTLTGTVADRDMKYRAEELAERVSGVKEVDNQIRVHKAQHDDPRRGKTATDKANKPEPS